MCVWPDPKGLAPYFTPEALPLELGGTLVEEPHAFVTACVRAQESHGSLGGFRLPFSVDEAWAGPPTAAAPTDMDTVVLEEGE